MKEYIYIYKVMKMINLDDVTGENMQCKLASNF